MTPAELSSRLRHMASVVDRAAKPSRRLVARALRMTLAGMEQDAGDPKNWCRVQQPELNPEFQHVLDEMLVLAELGVSAHDIHTELKALPELSEDDRMAIMCKVM